VAERPGEDTATVPPGRPTVSGFMAYLALLLPQF
jgi:hypothetical protein